MNDREILAKVVGWQRRTRILDANESPQVERTSEPVELTEWFAPNNSAPYARLAFDPFTDANDERVVFRHMMGQLFSVRRKYWRALRHIINERTDKLTKGGIEAAWPDAIMFLEDGDWSRAALKVLEK